MDTSTSPFRRTIGLVPVRLAQAEAERQRLRKSLAVALRLLRRHYRDQGFSGEARYVRLIYARSWMRRAAIDCLELDDACRSKGQEATFMRRLGPFEAPECLVGLRSLTSKVAQRLRTRASPLGMALRKGDDKTFELKRLLENIRELLRDGKTPQDALVKCQIRIQPMLISGDAAFFEQLGGIFKEHRLERTKYQRNLSDWLVRYWITLGLWGCPPNGDEAYERCRELAELTGYPLPRIGQFLDGWKNVRRRALRPVKVQ